MKKLLFLSLLFLSTISSAAWKMNPFTNKLDYYEAGISGSYMMNPATTTINANGYDMINLSTMTGKANTDFVWRAGTNNSLYLQPSMNNSVMIRNFAGTDNKLGYIEFFNKNYSYVDMDFNNQDISNIGSIAMPTAAYENIRAGTATIANSMPTGAYENIRVGTATIATTATKATQDSSGNNFSGLINIDACYMVLGSTTSAGTNAVRISPFYKYAVTISTITMRVQGGTNVVGMIEQRAETAIDSAGTDIWSGDVTVTTGKSGGTASDFTVPLGYALYFIPTSWSGAVNRVEVTGQATKD